MSIEWNTNDSIGVVRVAVQLFVIVDSCKSMCLLDIRKEGNVEAKELETRRIVVALVVRFDLMSFAVCLLSERGSDGWRTDRVLVRLAHRRWSKLGPHHAIQFRFCRSCFEGRRAFVEETAPAAEAFRTDSQNEFPSVSRLLLAQDFR